MFRNFFFNTLGPLRDPIGRFPDGGQKKNCSKKSSKIVFSPKSDQNQEFCPGGKFFLEIFFLNTLGPLRYPIGRILDGGHKKNGPKKWSTIIFPLYGPLKTQKTPWRSQKCPKKILNTWGVLTYPQRNFSDGEQKETLQKN